jgi:HemY protein
VIRLASWIVVSLLIAAAIAWLTSLPGTMTIEVMGYRMQPRLGVAAFLLIGLIVVMIVVWSIVRRIVTAPRYLARRAALRRKEAGVAALSDGYIALEAGDYARARMLAREARIDLPQNEAARLLEARADLALGDMGAAREHYRALITNRKTALAALAGLYEQARQQERPDVALTFAKKAALLAPDATWASSAVFDDLCRRRNRWQRARTSSASAAARPCSKRRWPVTSNRPTRWQRSTMRSPR